MRIDFVRQFSNSKIKYKFEDTKVKVVIEDIVYEFNFSELPNGVLDIKKMSETTLLINPLLDARKEKGELYIKLLLWTDTNETKEHILFPEEIDSSEYSGWIDDNEMIYDDLQDENEYQVIRVQDFWKSDDDLEKERLKEEEDERITNLVPDNEERLNYLEQAILFLMME